MGKHAKRSDPKTSDQYQDHGTKRRRSRRGTVAGTGHTAATGPEPRIESLEATPKTSPKLSKDRQLTERERWSIEQRPPHCETHTMPGAAVAIPWTGRSWASMVNAGAFAARSSWSNNGVTNNGTLSASFGKSSSSRS